MRIVEDNKTSDKMKDQGTKNMRTLEDKGTKNVGKMNIKGLKQSEERGSERER